MLALSISNNCIDFFDSYTFEKLGTINTDTFYPIFYFHPFFNTIYIESILKTLQIFELETFTKKFEFGSNVSGPIKFSPDGKVIVVGCKYNIEIYDTITFNKIYDLNIGILSICFSLDSKLLIIGCKNYILKIFDISEINGINQINEIHTTYVENITISLDNSKIATTSFGCCAFYIYSIESSNLLHTTKYGTKSCIFTKDSLISICKADIIILDINTFIEIYTITLDSPSINNLTWSLNMDKLFFIDYSKKYINIFDINNYDIVQLLNTTRFCISNTDYNIIYYITFDNTVNIYDIYTNEIIAYNIITVDTMDIIDNIFDSPLKDNVLW